MVCRSLMLALQRAGHVELPARKFSPPNPLAARRPPDTVAVDDHPMEGALHRLQPLEFRQVRRRAEEPLFNGLIALHHYLGYAHPVWYLETFVDRERYHGTCCRAANWLYLGQTTGRGKDAQSKRPSGWSRGITNGSGR